MATGIEGVSAVFSVVSLAVQLFQGCVEGYKICHTGQQIGRDGDLLNTKLAVQRTRLESWARKAGLPHNPNERLNWHPIILILGQQLALLRSATDLQNKYSLDGGEISSADDVSGRELQTADTTSLVMRLRPIFSRMQIDSDRKGQASNIRQRNNLVRRFTWAVADKDKLKEYVAEITKLNTQLVEYLQDHDQDELRREVDALYRILVSECRDTDQVMNVRNSITNNSAFAAIDAAAEVKDLRLKLKFDKREDEVSPDLKEAIQSKDFKYFNHTKLVQSVEAHDQGMCITSYNRSVVMVEWRTIGANWDNVQPSLKNLAMLLTSAKDSAFHTLKCAGYVNSPLKNRFGFVFDITNISTGGDPSSVQSWSLFQLLKDCRFVSVADRVRIAYDMTEAIMQLHTAGWLHKGVCSENIRFVAAARSSHRKVVAGNPYLIGYGYARLDSAVENTELPPDGIAYNSELNKNLYRHPNARGKDRELFQKRFDLYGLACVLIELAFWERLQSILQRYSAPRLDSSLPSLNEVFHDPEFQGELSHNIGPMFIEAIEMCLSAPDGSNGHEEAVILTEADVLEKLRSCKG